MRKSYILHSLSKSKTFFFQFLNLLALIRDIVKLNKLNKILEKMEMAESQQLKDLKKSPDDLITYTKLLSVLHKVFTILNFIVVFLLRIMKFLL